MNENSLFSHPITETGAAPHSSAPVQTPEFSDADQSEKR
jgi:hypothetical protein